MPRNGATHICYNGYLDEREDCPNYLHDWPLPGGYVEAGMMADARLRYGWKNLKCPDCGIYGWRQGQMRGLAKESIRVEYKVSDEVTQESKDLAESVGLVVQPDPVANDHPSAHDLVIKDILARGSTAMVDPRNLGNAYNLVLALYIGLQGGAFEAKREIQRRKEFGLEKYGTLLQPFNGREHIADANDELGDLLVYLKSHIYEQEHGNGAKAN